MFRENKIPGMWKFVVDFMRAYERWMLVVSLRGYKIQIVVSLRVFCGKRHHAYPMCSREGLVLGFSRRKIKT